jgi:thioredoxin-dependent peroxiredoxin
MATSLVGKKAPDFSLADAQGRNHKLSKYKGRKIVAYFYPKDDTPGCTREACAFRDNNEKFDGANALVIGISKDSPASHTKFIQKYGLPFILLTDPENKVAESYGAFGEKKMYGKTTKGIIRSTFLIDERGVVKNEWRKVKVDGHIDEVLKALLGLE